MADEAPTSSTPHPSEAADRAFADMKKSALYAVGIFSPAETSAPGAVYGESAQRIGEALLGMAGQPVESLREAARDRTAGITSHVELAQNRRQPERFTVSFAEPVSEEQVHAIRDRINALSGQGTAQEERGYKRNETDFHSLSIDTRRFSEAIIASGMLADGNLQAKGIGGTPPAATVQAPEPMAAPTPEIIPAASPAYASATLQKHLSDLEVVQPVPEIVVAPVSAPPPPKDMAAIARKIVGGKLDQYRGTEITEGGDPMAATNAAAHAAAWRARLEYAQKDGDIARS